MADRANIRVISPGMLSTVQDLGRCGLSSIGVGRGGAADTISLRVGNRLVGNADGAATIEMTWIGGTFEFNRDAVVALTGGLLDARLLRRNETRPFSMWMPQQILAGDRLALGPIQSGARSYLCVASGIDVPHVLNSRSTHLVGEFGGFTGRALKAGDGLAVGTSSTGSVNAVSNRDVEAFCMHILARRTIRAVEGAQYDLFNDEVIAAFWSSSFQVSMHSDRAGLRLHGRISPSALGGRMPSEGMMPGAVQVPESGEPIVLGVDHPTTGGYPVIACVAAVDHAVLGQIRPGEQIRFERITREQARQLYVDLERELTVLFPAHSANPGDPA